MLKDSTPLKDHKENVSYDVDSPLTNIPVKDTNEYAIYKIYDEKVLQTI